MLEIELKFQVPEASRLAVEAAVAAGTSRRTRLQAIYFDTPEQHLAAAGIALRLRKEGRRWVQTLKAAGADAMQRFEHNAPLLAAVPAGAIPGVDPQRHAGTPGEALLAAALAAQEGGNAPRLLGLYRTDIWRRHRALRAAGGTVELAFDSGVIAAEDRRWPVCELEIELLRGKPGAVIDVASRWVRRHGLWLDVRTKAERGDRLARNVGDAPAVKAEPTDLDAAMDVDTALRAIVGNCLKQILPSASEIAGGAATDEHVHQLRVGLRRLRSALRLFDGWSPAIDAEWDVHLCSLFRQLGAARDRDALAASLLPALREAGAPLFELPPGPVVATPTELLRAGEANLVLLSVLGFVAQRPAVSKAMVPAAALDESAATDLPEPTLTDRLAERLQDWHERVVRDAKRYAKIDDTARHRLRKRVKRLRYAAEFAAALFGRKAVQRYLKLLAPVQDSLGRYNDLCVGLAVYQGAVGDDPRAWFAIGWLTARRDVLLGESVAALKVFAGAEPFWKNG